MLGRFIKSTPSNLIPLFLPNISLGLSPLKSSNAWLLDKNSGPKFKFVVRPLTTKGLTENRCPQFSNTMVRFLTRPMTSSCPGPAVPKDCVHGSVSKSNFLANFADIKSSWLRFPESIRLLKITFLPGILVLRYPLLAMPLLSLFFFIL